MLHDYKHLAAKHAKAGGNSDLVDLLQGIAGGFLLVAVLVYLVALA